MFEFGEGRTTRSSIRSLKGEAAVKYITRATLQRASGSVERKSGVLAKRNIANSKMNDQTKSSHSGSSSISSELERNLSTRSEDEGFGSPSILPTIPTVLARPHHRLNQSWSLWYNRGDSYLTWAENQKMVGTVRTAEEFWQVQQLLSPPSALPVGVDLALFRAGVAPDWEDDANKAGGRWVARREHRQVDDAWLNLLLLLIGDHVETEVVTGAVVSVRKAGDKLALWIKEADDLETVVKVGRTVKERLGLRGHERLRFSLHREEKARLETGGERSDGILL